MRCLRPTVEAHVAIARSQAGPANPGDAGLARWCGQQRGVLAQEYSTGRHPSRASSTLRAMGSISGKGLGRMCAAVRVPHDVCKTRSCACTCKYGYGVVG